MRVQTAGNFSSFKFLNVSILAETAAMIHELDDVSTQRDAAEIIAELQLELKNACAIASETKSENEDLKRKLEAAVAFSNSNLQRQAEWKEVWKKEREVVSMRERQLERDEDMWKAKMEERRKELDELELKRTSINIVGEVIGSAGVLLTVLVTRGGSCQAWPLLMTQRA